MVVAAVVYDAGGSQTITQEEEHTALLEPHREEEQQQDKRTELQQLKYMTSLTIRYICIYVYTSACVCASTCLYTYAVL